MSSSIARVTARMPAPYQEFNNFAAQRPRKTRRPGRSRPTPTGDLGPGGTGKTELARAFGRWWRDTSGAERPEWVLWHSFEPGVGPFGLEGVIAQIGLNVYGPEFVQLASDDRIAFVEEFLAQHSLLLIWDNFETLRSMPDSSGASSTLSDAECTRISEFLARLAAGGRSTVIITSRSHEGWLGDVHRIEVAGLSRAEAAEYAGLLLAPYPACGRRREKRAFGELLEWLDGHPLSMRVVLPLLDAREPEDLLDGLRGTVPLDLGSGGETFADRSTSLPESVTYSFTHLTGMTRRLLPAVCLSYGVADIEVLAVFSEQPSVPRRFAGVTRQEWRETLEDATRVGLLTVVDGAMYQVHPALPAYLAAQWRNENPAVYDSERTQAMVAFATACAGLCVWLDQQVKSGDAEMAYVTIDWQQRTFRTLLGLTIEHQQWDEAVAIAALLERYWKVRGLTDEAAGWSDRVRVATEDSDGNPPRSGEPSAELWMVFAGGRAEREERAGRLGNAEAIYRQILDLARAQPSTRPWQEKIALSSHKLGVLAQRQGRLEEAEDWHRAALAVREDLGDMRGVFSDCHALGSLAHGQARLDEAENWHRKALHASQEIGDRPRIIASALQLGIFAHQKGRVGEAEAYYRSAVTETPCLDNDAEQAQSYYHLGIAAGILGRPEEAEVWYYRALAISESFGDRPQVSEICGLLGGICQDQARTDEAEDWYRKALTVSEEIQDLPSVAENCMQLGFIAHWEGRFIDARDWFRKALGIEEDLGNRPGKAIIYGQLAMICEHSGDFDEAEIWSTKALASNEARRDLPGIALSYDFLGALARKRHQLDLAEEWYRKSLAVYGSLDQRSEMANIYHLLVLLREEQGRPDQALELTIKSVTLFDVFPHPLAGVTADDLSRLTGVLGVTALEE